MPALKIPQSLVVCLGLAVLSVAGWSQTPDVATPNAPTSASPTPDEFMRQAADAMSLTAPDMKPWHMRARFKYFAPDGSLQRELVIEEWWDRPDHTKTTLTGKNFERTEYRAGETTVFTGSDGILANPARLLLHPLPSAASLDRVSLTPKEVTVGTTDLHCFTETRKDPVRQSGPTASFCFDPSLPMLRISEDSFGTRIIFNRIIKIHGHYVAKQVTVSNEKQDPLYTGEVELIDPELGIESSALDPPADAKLLKPTVEIAIAPGVMQGNKISGDSPRYPPDAKAANIQGTVVIQGTVGKDGTIIALHVISGPPMLQQAAMNAVKTWRYRPYLLNGEPVQVETTMNIVFNLTR